jgi:3-hydroxy-3-methylglutaryl CoA synthase
MFSVLVRGSIDEIRKNCDIEQRLKSRQELDPNIYSEVSFFSLAHCQILEQREKIYNATSFKPTESTDHLTSGTYYLEELNSKSHRIYKIK